MMAEGLKTTSILDLRPGVKNVTCSFIVIDKGTTSQTKDGSVVRKCRVADASGSILFSLWNEQAAAIEEGDILRLIKGYASQWKGSMVLYSGKYGILEKIGEFTMVYSEEPDMSNSSLDFGQALPGQRVRADDRLPLPNRNGSNSTQRSEPFYSDTHSPHRTHNHKEQYTSSHHHRPSTSYS